MGLLHDLEARVDGYLSGDYETYVPRDVPAPEEIPLGNKAAKIEATTVFMDLRQSSDITNAFRRQTAAKMLKAYFAGAVKIVNDNGGVVRSFNGDGMLAIFTGKSRSNNAVSAAMKIDWFVTNVLRPKFRKYFESNNAAVGNALSFDVGFGIDDGSIYAVRIGIRGTNDVAWVGRCTNTSAKLSNVPRYPSNIAVTREVYGRLVEPQLLSSVNMWSDERLGEFGGVIRAYRTTSYNRAVS